MRGTATLKQRSLTNAILALVADHASCGSRTATSAPRSCSTSITSRQAFFIIRQHSPEPALGARRRAAGLWPDPRPQLESSSRSEIQTTNDAGEKVLFLRRVTVVLDKATRDGDTDILVLSNLPREDASTPGDCRVVSQTLDH